MAYGDKANLNEIVDRMLDDARFSVLHDRRQLTPIPEFTRVYPLGFHYDNKNVTGKLDCRQGWARDMSTVYRTGDAVLSRNSDRLILDVALGMSRLEFGFDHCEISILPFFSKVTNFTVTVGKNSIHVQTSVRLNGVDNCRPTLDSFHVNEAEDIEVHTGQGIAQQVKDKIISTLLNHFHEEILGIVTMELIDIARGQLSNSTFC